MDSSSATSQAHFSMSRRMPVIKTQETANRCILRFISESDVTTEYVTFRFVTRVTEKPVEPQEYTRNHSRHKRYHILPSRTLEHQEQHERLFLVPRAGYYDTKDGVKRQDVSCRRWAANNPVTSLTSSNSQLALVSTHQLSLIQYFLSHCISKSLHPSSLFLLPGSFRSNTCLGYGLPTVLWLPLYIYCL